MPTRLQMLNRAHSSSARRVEIETLTLLLMFLLIYTINTFTSSYVRCYIYNLYTAAAEEERLTE